MTTTMTLEKTKKMSDPHLPLSKTEMLEAMAFFNECQAHTLASRSEQDRLEIDKWIKDLALMSPAYSLRQDAIVERQKRLYSAEHLREYVFDLGFMFFAMCGIPHAPWRLSANIAEGLSMDGFDVNLSGIPDTILGSMALASTAQLLDPLPWWKRWLGHKPQDLVTFLANNKPLLVEYLLYLTNTSAPESAPSA